MNSLNLCSRAVRARLATMKVRQRQRAGCLSAGEADARCARLEAVLRRYAAQINDDHARQSAYMRSRLHLVRREWRPVIDRCLSASA